MELQLAKNLYNKEKKMHVEGWKQNKTKFNPVNVTIKIMVMRTVN